MTADELRHAGLLKCSVLERAGLQQNRLTRLRGTVQSCRFILFVGRHRNQVPLFVLYSCLCLRVPVKILHVQGAPRFTRYYYEELTLQLREEREKRAGEIGDHDFVAPKARQFL